MNLIAGHTYRVEVTGLYQAGSITADAECSMSALDPIYRPDRDGSGTYDLLVNGHDIAWSPTDPDLVGCNSASHRYSYTFRPAVDGPVAFELNIPPGMGDATGSLDVQVSGDAATSPTPATSATTQPPSSQPPSSQPDAPLPQPTTAPGAASPTTPKSSTAPAASDSSAISSDAQNTIEDLLGTVGTSPDELMTLAQTDREPGNTLPGGTSNAGAQPIMVAVAALAAAAAAASPVRNRILAAARGIDGFDILQRQTSHRGAEAPVAPATAPAKGLALRLAQRRGPSTALAHRSPSRAARMPTLIVDDQPSASAAAPSACSCGYCT